MGYWSHSHAPNALSWVSIPVPNAPTGVLSWVSIPVPNAPSALSLVVSSTAHAPSVLSWFIGYTSNVSMFKSFAELSAVSIPTLVMSAAEMLLILMNKVKTVNNINILYLSLNVAFKRLFDWHQTAIKKMSLTYCSRKF